MIKIYKYGEVANSEVFSRENISSNVEGVVSEIIANVIKKWINPKGDGDET